MEDVSDESSDECVILVKKPRLETEDSGCSSQSNCATRQLKLTELLTKNTSKKPSEQSEDSLTVICVSSDDETTPKPKRSWCGSPLSELSYGPSTYPVLTPLKSSLLHCVTIRTDINSSPPTPYPSSFRDVWDSEHVRMPCSEECLYPIQSQPNTSFEGKWKLITKALRQPISNSHDLEKTILSYNTRFARKWTFHSLHLVLNDHMTLQQRDEFFNTILPKMVDLALSLPSIVTHAIPLLRKQQNYSLTLSQHQIACLLANAFFCTYPRRNTTAATSEYSKFPSINFNTLFTGRQHNLRKVNKIKCIINYFRRVTTQLPAGTITFTRQVCKIPPKWEDCKMPFTKLHIASEGTIEDNGHGMLQVDFANKYVGGGVLSQGCVQEEIRFLISPELLVSMLFTEELDDNECLLITGAEQYSTYSGYADTFVWSGDHVDQTLRDEWGRRQIQLVAIDALIFHSNKGNQFKPGLMCRELNKAYCGFFCENSTTSGCQATVATGNWGCGAFGGDPCLKAILQWMAASVAKRDVMYFTFYQDELLNELDKIHSLITRSNVNVGVVWQTLVGYYNTVIKQRLKISLYTYLEDNIK